MDALTYADLEKFLQAKELKYFDEEGHLYVLFENIQLRFYLDKEQFRVDGIWRGVTSDRERTFATINSFNQNSFFPKHLVQEADNGQYMVVFQVVLSQEKGLSIEQMENFIEMTIPIFLDRAAELDKIFPGAWEA